MLNQKLTGQQAAEKTYIEDVFSTYLYTGNGSTQTITNGIDLAGKGGLVWTKNRNGAEWHDLEDTVRGATKWIASNSTGAQVTNVNAVTSFTSTGYTLGSEGQVNRNASTYASWTFRKAPKFFDVVTYTGDGTTPRTLSHSLGVSPGMVIVKATSGTSRWTVWHRSVSPDYFTGYLNTTDAFQNAIGSSKPPNLTASTFDVHFASNADYSTNTSGVTYVAYLFAHDTTTDGLIQCGSYTGNGSATGPTVNLGWEPQYLLIKDTSAANAWFIVDSMRDMPVGGSSAYLRPESSAAENLFGSMIALNATGFQIGVSSTSVNTNGNTYIYMAIRRPMKTPTDGTKVFMPQATRTATNGTASQNAYTSNFPVDLFFQGARVGSTSNATFYDRLRGSSLSLVTSSTDVEGSGGVFRVDDMDGVYTTSSLSATSSFCGWMFQRAPGFFDVVCYTGTGSARTINHNLGVAPELMIVKCRNNAASWPVYTTTTGNTKYLKLDDTIAATTLSTNWNNTSPTATTFTVGTSNWTGAAYNYVAYLFASCPGVSKVGSYTGNGSSQTINCGFSAGARFVLIKRTDSTGDWYVWDTARGIVAGNDPHLSLNTTAAEVTTDDTIDPTSTGFIVNQLAATNVNVNAATYIYLAIA